MQQHLLLLFNDSVGNKKKNDELSTKNHLLTNQLNNDSVGHKKRIDELFTQNQLLRKDSVEHKKRFDELFTGNQRINNQRKNDSVGHKKRIDELFTQNQLLRKDSVEHNKKIDELFTENQRLNQQLKETKADLNLFKENDQKASDEQMISKLLDQCVTDVCDDFNKIVNTRCSKYTSEITILAYPKLMNSLLPKFCSFEEILVEAEVQKVIDQFSKAAQEINNNFIQDEVLHAYKRTKIDNIDDLNKLKTILPSSSSCWKEANEKMKSCVDICFNIERMKRGLKLVKFIEERMEKFSTSTQEWAQKCGLLQEGNKCLYVDPYHYYQITLASLPVTRIIYTDGVNIDVTITVNPQNNVVSLSFKVAAYPPVLVDATGQKELRLKCVVQHREYICEQSINELKGMGYIVNDGFVLRTL